MSPTGGIKSADEVVRIVTLMQKFSKKLVFKCMYVQILKSTPVDLLEKFLDSSGWDLLNAWFEEGIKLQNWPFCKEMVELFKICPISVDRLKENVEKNQAPKLINQLRNEPQVDDQLRELTSQVYQKWVDVVSPSAQKQPIAKLTLKVPAASVGLASSGQVTDKDGSGTISLLQSLADEVSENIKKEENKAESKTKSKHHSSSSSKSKDDKKHHHHENGKSKDKSDKEKEERRKRREEREKERERDRKRARPDYIRDQVDPAERARIKELAKRLKAEEQAKKDKETLNKVTGSLSLAKIPKIPKKSADDKNKSNSGLSFDAALGVMDNKPKTVKTPMNKNKTASMLEGMKKSSSSSSKSKSDTKKDAKKDSTSKRDSSSAFMRSSSDKKPLLERKTTNLAGLVIPEKKKSSSGDQDSPKGTKSPHSVSESTGFMDALFGSMANNDQRKKKRRLSDAHEKKSDSSHNSPKAAKSPKLEKDEEKKEKEDAPAPPAFSFYRDTLETPEEEKDSPLKNKKSQKSPPLDESLDDAEDHGEDVPFEEPDTMPREVKGILVYHRGSEKRKRSITWRPEKELVAVKYFILDEDERVNVNKIKFENMRQMELKMENAAIKSKGSMDEDERVEFWYTPKPINKDPDNEKKDDQVFVPGHESTEKEAQAIREKSVLQALYFSPAMTPSNPTEPDHEPYMRREPTLIPLEDMAEDAEQPFDFRREGWPDAKVNQVDHQNKLETTFSLPPALSNLLNSVNLQNILPPNPQQLSHEEQQTLAAQTEAMKALGILPGSDQAPPPSFPPPSAPNMNVPPPKLQQQPPPFMAGPPGPSFDGPPPGFPPPQMAPPPAFNQGFPVPPHTRPGFQNFRGGPPRGFPNARGARGSFRGGFPR